MPGIAIIAVLQMISGLTGVTHRPAAFEICDKVVKLGEK